MTARSERTYLPAAGRDLFLPLYDPLTRLLGVEKVRHALIVQAELRPYQRVLDLGCGTGELTTAIKRQLPSVEVVALDPDPRALERARQKADESGVAIRFDRGFADALPYEDGAFDRVFSSLMFHHLEPEARPRMLSEVRRVLTPQGRLELLDFDGTPSTGWLARVFHSHDRLRDNSEERLVQLLSDAGFSQITRVGTRRTLFGRVAFYQATANKSHVRTATPVAAT